MGTDRGGDSLNEKKKKNLVNITAERKSGFFT